MAAINVEDWRRLACARLPRPLFHYLEGGADDEVTLKRNRESFSEVEFVPRVLVDVSRISMATRVLGIEVELPLILSPTGMSQLFHSEAECGVARAAGQAGVLYALSTMASTSIEDVAQASLGPKAFQVYIFRDRGLTLELIERSKAAGYQALIVTVDTPMAGNRERDRRSGLSMPPDLRFLSALQFLTRPRWLFDYWRGPAFQLANVADREEARLSGPTGVIEYVNRQFDRSVSWPDIAWLRDQWDGPLAIKGIAHPTDAARAVALGVEAIFLSNHGGRQLDHASAAFEMLGPTRDVIGDAAQIIIDGGIRRGSDVVKALCLGATACSIGRPYLYGLTAAGTRGVAAVLQLLREEIERSLTLLGCPSARDAAPAFLRNRSNGMSS